MNGNDTVISTVLFSGYTAIFFITVAMPLAYDYSGKYARTAHETGCLIHQPSTFEKVSLLYFCFYDFVGYTPKPYYRKTGVPTEKLLLVF